MLNQPNVVWVTLDSVRMDHTSMAGYKRDTTPNIAEIGNEGFSHKSCIAPGQGTPFSSASFLTGTYPFRHGLQSQNEYLPSELDTVPELLSNEGYTTAGLSRNSFVGPGTGLHRGFDQFEWIDSSRLLEVVPFSILLSWGINIRQHSAGFTTDTGKHSTPYLMNGIARRWLDKLENKQPFFFYLHYNEPHHPYYPPLPYLNEYIDEIEFTQKEATAFAMDMHENYRSWIANERELSRDELDALEALYDAEIRYTDEMIGNLFDYIQSLGLEDTIFVVTADHGDFFGEKGLLSHVLSIDDGVTHTPLVVHGLENLGEKSPVIQQIDVMQSILTKVGADTSQFQGVDLRAEDREYAITNRAPIEEQVWKEYNPNFDVSRFHKRKLTSIRTESFRYQKSGKGAELYRLPDETEDVKQQYPNVASELDAVLEEWVSSDGVPIEEELDSQLDENMRKQLRDLGYVE